MDLCIVTGQNCGIPFCIKSSLQYADCVFSIVNRCLDPRCRTLRKSSEHFKDFGGLDLNDISTGQLPLQNTKHITGFRYDHYATLCELLPVGLPSLRCCLAVLANKGKVTYKNLTFCEIVPAILVC